MHMNPHTEKNCSSGNDAGQLVLREARKLHRAATSESLAISLPILRRILATNTLRGISLPELFRRRDTVQRKHILRMLAIEAGFGSWEDYRPALDRMTAGQLEHFDIVRREIGYPNYWFSTQIEAEQYARLHGGRVMRVGQQAVVIARSEVALQ